MSASKLRVACAYQGGKQRVAEQIARSLIAASPSRDATFYDLCCGSGAISIELVNQGVRPSQIVMLDLSPWAAFWQAIGNSTFNMDVFVSILDAIPDDKRAVKAHMARIAAEPVGQYEAETYPVLQSCSFGGKQIWQHNGMWENAFFRDYWVPTATSVRRSPANPMQPSVQELRRRIEALASGMQGLTCLRADIVTVLQIAIPKNAVIYIDPPYAQTTGYGYTFEVKSVIEGIRARNSVPIFVSEGRKLGENARLLTFGGAKGGISGAKTGKHEEWLNYFP
ncbi:MULTISPECIES: DNA adenine methylase [Kocuria]|uniref:DNA adenine methylase n=1 Tax=Kocuria tytonis TaxID=2054280 RepID=A0A495A602_9MICC|nr:MULTISPECIES: DNA adenine methylase [Kocuria]RKQ35263.1 hypothetical protein C1C97_008495 [Kocuria tytonis]RUP85195.1 hypothetical protein D8M39_00210 [Kocuria sp. HSID17590]RUQ10647.1 hypothetical protein D8M38_04155 [Kocuria sp. HSID17582]